MNTECAYLYISLRISYLFIHPTMNSVNFIIECELRIMLKIRFSVILNKNALLLIHEMQFFHYSIIILYIILYYNFLTLLYVYNFSKCGSN